MYDEDLLHNTQLQTTELHSTSTGNRTGGNWQLATGNWQLATGNWQLATVICDL